MTTKENNNQYNLGDEFILPVFNTKTGEWRDTYVTIAEKIKVDSRLFRDGEYFVLNNGEKVFRNNLFLK